jgi:hypothetical protein
VDIARFVLMIVAGGMIGTVDTQRKAMDVLLAGLIVPPAG